MKSPANHPLLFIWHEWRDNDADGEKQVLAQYFWPRHIFLSPTHSLTFMQSWISNQGVTVIKNYLHIINISGKYQRVPMTFIAWSWAFAALRVIDDGTFCMIVKYYKGKSSFKDVEEWQHRTYPQLAWTSVSEDRKTTWLSSRCCSRTSPGEISSWKTRLLVLNLAKNKTSML